MVIKSKPIRILLKIMAITSVSIMGLFLIIGILLHIPAIQKSIINKAESFYFNKTNVKLEIEGIHLNIRGGLAISGIYVPDQKNDTLLYATSISTGLNYIKLLSNQIDLGTIKLEGITCNLLKNNEDSLFNFQFIADAFASTDTSVKDTTSEGMTLVADQLDVQNLSFTLYDQVSGMNLKSTIADLSIEINRMNLDSFQFHLGKIDLQGASVQFATLKEQYTDSTTNSTSPDITFETINIKNCEYYQMSIPDSSGMIVKCRNSYLESQSMSLPNNIIHIKEIMLDGATFQTYNKKTVAQTNTKETDAIQITIPYDISLSHLQIKTAIFPNKTLPTPYLNSTQ
jgi:translocation and assembly module TamB